MIYRKEVLCQSEMEHDCYFHAFKYRQPVTHEGALWLVTQSECCMGYKDKKVSYTVTLEKLYTLKKNGLIA